MAAIVTGGIHGMSAAGAFLEQARANRRGDPHGVPLRGFLGVTRRPRAVTRFSPPAAEQDVRGPEPSPFGDS
jgi:hypothetical protein